jgi:hypothetical protein
MIITCPESPTECGASECDHETSTMRRGQVQLGLSNHVKKLHNLQLGIICLRKLKINFCVIDDANRFYCNLCFFHRTL